MTWFRVTLWILLIGLISACGAETTETTSAPAANADPTPTREVINAGAQAADEPQTLVLATTTSPDDSGLLAAILPDFEAQFNATVSVVAVGTGQALQLGAAGDADVLLVHAPTREDAFITAGDGTERISVMVNDFVIAGPEADPASIAGTTDAITALTTIAESEAPFISRGDDSGTHIKELTLWAAANITPDGSWYQAAGQGMGAVLTIANEQQAYTLTDRGTFAARVATGIDLVILSEGDPQLTNPYSVIPVNPAQHDTVNAELARQFVIWITSVETQQMIADFTIDGQQLFTPDSAQWQAAQGTD